MQTVNFQCGHCRKLMAVSTEYLGQQVRCPHCQQVVVAPSTSQPPTLPLPMHLSPVHNHTPAPAPTPPPRPEPEPVMFRSAEAESEDIFHEPSEPEDALFSTENSKVKLPPPMLEPIQQQVSIPEPVLEPIPTLNQPEVFPPTYQQPSPVGELMTAAFSPAVETNKPQELPTNWHPSAEGTAPAPTLPGPMEPAPMPADNAPQVRRPKQAQKLNLFFPLVFMPLVLYAIVMTAAVGFLYMKLKTAPPHPLEFHRDTEGDAPGVKPVKGKSTKRESVTPRKFVLQSLPEKLFVNLGETLTLGDLEITPTKVERKRVRVHVEGSVTAEPVKHDSLVLHLTLKNVSKDWVFAPMDNYFDRHCANINGDRLPLTVLLAGREQFFGGSCKWFSVEQRKDRRREWMEGRTNMPVELEPGQELKTFISYDGDDDIAAKYLFGLDEENKPAGKPYNGSLVWRVHLRRGQVSYKDQPTPVTSVIGVKFTSKDYLGS